MRGRYASRLMLHPVTPVAIALLILNDHVLKRYHPGLVTGKLSDVAGLIVFPLMLAATIDLVVGVAHNRERSLMLSILVTTAACFAGIQLSPSIAEIYQNALGAIQFPFRALAGATRAVSVEHTADMTDLLAVPALAVPWLIGVRIAGGNNGEGGTPPNMIAP